ncbi:hypothetical protein SAMN05216228_101541 [Rhizobium tibeticum]|uniref:Uncharacterized protein n=1 Tax=Rhizobium tibeticum TaxID=501024 RepID=A0A1H8NQT0_9HYPH|nr:hypothetical protein RTCCBAU85039_3668 [Rhizobium tibeticum]SEO31960.1 hypothetical protein SAMN05216228_101541 [Rhizobium tibeticum]
MPYRIHPPLPDELGIGSPDLGAEQGIVPPTLRCVNVQISRHDIIVADQQNGHFELKQLGRIGLQALKPSKLVFELWAWSRIAVRKIEAADQQAVYHGLDIASVSVVRIAGKAAPRQDWQCAPCQDGNAVPALLAVPYSLISGASKFVARKSLVDCLEFLKADNVGAIFLQPPQQHCKAAVDAIDVIRGYFHAISEG